MDVFQSLQLSVYPEGAQDWMKELLVLVSKHEIKRQILIPV